VRLRFFLLGQLSTLAEYTLHGVSKRDASASLLHCLTGGDECRDLNYVHNMSVKILARMATLVTMWQHIRTGYDPIAQCPELSYAANLL